MDLKGTQIKDTFGNLVTVGSSAGIPTTGTIYNGNGDALTDVSFAGNVQANTFTGNGSAIVGYNIPTWQASWLNTTPPYGNLTSAADNYLPWNAEDYNTDTNVYGFVGSGTTDARVLVKQAGYYEVTCRIHLFDLANNVDIVVKLMTSNTSTGTMTLDTLLCDKKFAELTADQLLFGSAIVDLAANTYVNVVVNPSAQAPFPSDSNQTPSSFYIKKIG